MNDVVTKLFVGFLFISFPTSCAHLSPATNLPTQALSNSASGPDYLSDHQFAKYPIEIHPIAPKTNLDLTNHIGHLYRTSLRYEWEEAQAPNLADHYYAFRKIGCGSGCQVLIIADWKTGQLTQTKLFGTFETRRESRAVVTSPKTDCEYMGYHKVYLFEGRKLKEIVSDYCP